MRRKPAALAAIAATAALAATLAGTAASGASTPSAKKASVTLLVWDQEVRGGQNAAMKALNSAFEKKYPTIKINRVAKSFTDLQTTLKLAASGPNPPDVVEANNGYSAMGPLVQAKLLMPLDRYVGKYGWNNRYSTGIRRMNMFSTDGKHFGTGSLFGLPMTGEVVGVYYNKAKLASLGLKLPKTFQQFEAALAKAKAAGETPIQFGNLDKWPGIHEYEEPLLQYAPKSWARTWIFGTGAPSFNIAATKQAATTLRDWVTKGYFTDGFAGLGYDPSWGDFGKGQGVFLVTGSWVTADLKKALGSKVGFFLMPPRAGSSLATLGGEGLPWAVSSKTRNADAAAQYLNFITSPQAAKVLVANGLLPAMRAAVKVPKGLDTEVYATWKLANAKDAIVPYLDWATPTMYNTVTAAVQELMAGKSTPASFVAKVQADYAKFHAGGR